MFDLVETFDPRPQVRDHVVQGSRCANCGYQMAVQPPRCPVCSEEPMEVAEFGPGGTVFASTVLRIPVPGRTPPYRLAYVDLDDGPRILAHATGADDGPLVPGARVRIVGRTDDGDPLVEEAA